MWFFWLRRGDAAGAPPAALILRQAQTQGGHIRLKGADAIGLFGLRKRRLPAGFREFAAQAILDLQALGHLGEGAVHAVQNAVGERAGFAGVQAAATLSPAEEIKVGGEVTLTKVLGPVGVGHEHPPPPERTRRRGNPTPGQASCGFRVNT